MGSSNSTSADQNAAPTPPQGLPHHVRVKLTRDEADRDALLPVTATLDDPATLYASLVERSYAVLSFDASEVAAVEAIVTEDADAFFGRDLDDKQRLKDTTGANRGYVGPGSYREYLKVLRSEAAAAAAGTDETEGGPLLPASTSDHFEETFEALNAVVWRAFVAVRDASADAVELSDHDLSEIQQCIVERSSVSLIHYYAAGDEEATARREEIEAALKAELGEEGLAQAMAFEGASSHEGDDDVMGGAMGGGEGRSGGQFVVCGTHKDTGVFTLIRCSESPGLQVFDRVLDRWVKAEEEVSVGPSEMVMFLIMGQKAPLFCGSALQATTHRVVCDADRERYSLLFFMDTAKLS